MSLRWKNQLPQLQPNFVDPAGVNATRMQGFQPGVVPTPASYAAQDMQGYNPNNVYMGRVSDRAGQPGSGNGYQFDSREIDEYTAQKDAEVQALQQREQAMQQIQQLEARLDEINARIAEIDKALPAGAGNDKAWEIAAQRASIGDMTAYDSMVQRGATGFQTANAIDNALMDAEKLGFALKSKNAEDKQYALDSMRIALEKAERDSKQSGVSLPSSYYRLRNTYEAAMVDPENPAGPKTGKWQIDNAESTINKIRSMVTAKSFSDADVKELDKWVADHPNSGFTQEIKAEVDKHRNNTVEKRAAAKREKDAAYIDFKDVKDLGNNAAGQPKIFEVMQGWEDKRRKRFMKYYNVDPKTGKVTKK